MKVRSPTFGAVPVLLFQEEGLTLADVRVYAVLAMFQGNHEDSYPSRETIAQKANISVESVSRAISHLVEMGWCEREQRGFGQSNVYRVMMETDEYRNATGGISSNATGTPPEMPPVTLPSIKQKHQLKKKDRYQEPRHKHGEYQHVLLTGTELERLKKDFPLDWQERIVRLDEYIQMKGVSYKDHNLTIRNWAKRDRANEKPKEFHDMTDEEKRYAIDKAMGRVS